MRWNELDFKKDRWTIPAERTKSGRETWVPLSPLALELIGEPDEFEHVFTSYAGRPFSLYTISQGMRRERETLGLAKKAATPHDLRRTLATHLGEMEVDRLTIGKLLNHSETGVTGKVYDVSERWRQKRTAMLAWSDKLQEITSGVPVPDKVTKLRAG